MTEKGTWIGHHAALAYDALARVRISAPLADQIIRELSQAGLLVSTAYYLPSMDELYRNWQEMRYAARSGLKPRWVMCVETWTGLAQRYRNQRTVAPIELRWSLAVEEEPGTFVAPPESVFVVNVLGNRLFDSEIRLDPAARRPMWEVVE